MSGNVKPRPGGGGAAVDLGEQINAGNSVKIAGKQPAFICGAPDVAGLSLPCDVELTLDRLADERRTARRGVVGGGQRVMSASDLITKLRPARENSRAATTIDGARRATDLAQEIASDALDPEDLAAADYALAGALLDLCDAIERALAAESAR